MEKEVKAGWRRKPLVLNIKDADVTFENSNPLFARIASW
jgi:hypothetical protein